MDINIAKVLGYLSKFKNAANHFCSLYLIKKFRIWFVISSFLQLIRPFEYKCKTNRDIDVFQMLISNTNHKLLQMLQWNKTDES